MSAPLIVSVGSAPQIAQPPNGSCCGTPSSVTKARPAPDGPIHGRVGAHASGDADLASIRVGEKAERRSGRALEAVVLARRGQFRESVLAIRDAFQALGGPFQASVPEEARRLYYPIAYENAVRSAAQRNGLPVSVVFGIIRQESAFDLRARSHAGAAGLMQVMPATARWTARR